MAADRIAFGSNSTVLQPTGADKPDVVVDLFSSKLSDNMKAYLDAVDIDDAALEKAVADFRLQQTAFLRCPKCRELILNPVVGECGHTYCGDCVSVSQNEKSRCALCSVKCHFSPNYALRDMLSGWSFYEDAKRKKTVPYWLDRLKEVGEPVSRFQSNYPDHVQLRVLSILLSAIQQLNESGKESKTSELDPSKCFFLFVRPTVFSYQGSFGKFFLLVHTRSFIFHVSGQGSNPLSE